MNSNTVLGILGVAAVASLAYSLTSQPEKEDFIFDLTYRTIPEVVKTSDSNYLMTRGQYQGMQPYRMYSGVSDYMLNGTADVNLQGYNPERPLGTGGCKVSTVENYKNIANSVTTEKYEAVVPQAQQVQAQFNDYVNELPIGTMTEMDPAGNVEQVAVYDRYVFTTQHPHNWVGGVNYFAGDLPIEPLTTSVFFNTANAVPGTDLAQGALFVMGGVDNQTSKQLLSLQQKYKGGGLTTFAGVNLTEPRNMYEEPLASGLTTQVGVTSFPGYSG